MRTKATLLQRIIWAISDFRIYPFAQREKVSKAFSYFAKLIALASVALAIYFYTSSINLVSDFIYTYQREMPDFTLENGMLTSDEAAKFKYKDSLVIVDTNYSEKDLLNNSADDVKDYNSFVLISNDKLNIYVKEDDSTMLISSVQFKNIRSNTDKQKLANDANKSLNSTSFKFCLFALLFIITYLCYLLSKLLSSIMAMLIAFIFSSMFGLKMKFKNYFIMAMYVLTLPVIIETIAILVVGKVSESTELIYQVLVCIYTFYALRALKLDQILLSNELKDLKEELSNGNFTEIKFDENKVEEETDKKDDDENEIEKTDEENNDENK